MSARTSMSVGHSLQTNGTVRGVAIAHQRSDAAGPTTFLTLLFQLRPARPSSRPIRRFLARRAIRIPPGLRRQVRPAGLDVFGSKSSITELRYTLLDLSHGPKWGPLVQKSYSDPR